MADQVSVRMDVAVGGKKATVAFTRPLALSGDRRRHRKQLRELADEAIISTLAVLGGQFEAGSDA